MAGQISLLASLLILISVPCAHSYIQVYGSYGGRCLDECLKRRNDYRWCNTDRGDWDYCSPWVGTGSYGGQCRVGHNCENHGYEYRWCYTDNDNNWDYCSRYQQFQGERELTRYGYFCTSQCTIREGRLYGCNYGTGSDWDYCSPAHNTGREGTACIDNHWCYQHGNALGNLYYWCRINADGSWEYCSPYKEDCTYWPKTQLDLSALHAQNSSNVTQKEVPMPQQTKVCEVEDYARRFKVEFEEEADSNSGSVRPQQPNYRHVVNIVEMYAVERITSDRQVGTVLYRNEGVQIVYQQRIAKHNRYYCVLQLRSNQGSLISEIQIPQEETFSLKFLRRAFMNCVQKQCRTVILRYPAGLKRSQICQ